MTEWILTALQLFLVAVFGTVGIADLWNGDKPAHGLFSVAVAAMALAWWLA